MASTPLGDIPGARFHNENAASVTASVASNGAGARFGQVGPYAHNVRIRNAWWIPTGTDQGANTGSYRRISIFDGGPSGTVTATANRVASLGMTASQASLGAMAFSTVDRTISAGNVIYFSHDTVGGVDVNGSALQAGQLAYAYEVM